MREMKLPRCVLEYKDEVDFEDLSLIEDSSERLKKALFRQRIKPLIRMSVMRYQKEAAKRSAKFFVRHQKLATWCSVSLYFAVTIAAFCALYSFANRNYLPGASGLAALVILARLLNSTDVAGIATWKKVSLSEWMRNGGVLSGRMLSEMDELERLCPGIKFFVEKYTGPEKADAFLIVGLGDSAFYIDRLPLAI